jgi:lipopolysaccharide export system protein LptA
MYRHVAAVGALASANVGNSTRAATGSNIPAATDPAPIDFRCDSLSILTAPNRNLCVKNVVIRRGDLVLCCDIFEGFADASWTWERFICRDSVRAQRGAETIWADKAEFFASKNDLVLTGHPVLQRGDTQLAGSRVTLDLTEDHARIWQPRGRLQPDRSVSTGREPLPLPLRGPLPGRCPIPPLKR